ncbi:MULTISPECIES: CdaR family protein [Ureibacillus]|jgi:YbbR domain-containing protein|uniref:YbbR domain-containing protein n=1 Tax=Ureibacillus thermosphaericus TaxID=51173 RepID=A0A840PRF5_URETH|nr:CdaR family protein [Ureibacillus thermosphaericus]MBB5148480.1 YbbR domain-containing protein [Ureibacillus thermosphaericus]NKZ31194.1 hypothetical protein [Ureibacillus thermosphaericus]
MDKFFDNIWVLRATAFILAFLLFFYVKAELTGGGKESTSNNHVDIITDVPLEVYYDSENLIVTGLPETVDVTIEGPMQIVLKTKFQKDFKVFVDLNSLLIGEHRVTIQHENFSDKLNVTIDPEVVDVVIEEKVTQEFRVDPEINNRLFAEGYVLKSMMAEPSKVIVTGAKSIIENISYVKATVSAPEGIKESFTQEANVKVLDSNLNKLDVSIQPETVNVTVEVEEYSRDIPITLRQIGTPQQGVVINELNTDTKTIELFGPKSIIDSLKSLVVEFDVSKVDRSGNYEVDLNLPKGATKLGTDKIIVRANVTKTPTQSDSVDEETDEDQSMDEPNGVDEEIKSE